jgi:hypothetical protein
MLRKAVAVDRLWVVLKGCEWHGLWPTYCLTENQFLYYFLDRKSRSELAQFLSVSSYFKGIEYLLEALETSIITDTGKYLSSLSLRKCG